MEVYVNRLSFTFAEAGENSIAFVLGMLESMNAKITDAKRFSICIIVYTGVGIGTNYSKALFLDQTILSYKTPCHSWHHYLQPLQQ